MNKLLVGVLSITLLLGTETAFAATMGADAMMKDTMATGTTMKDGMMKDALMPGETMMSKPEMADGDLMMGSRGDGVVTLQTFLESTGHLVIPAGIAKGYFGDLTKMALKKYQIDAGVKPTGYYGPLTRAAMHAAMMKKDGAMMKDGAMKPTI